MVMVCQIIQNCLQHTCHGMNVMKKMMNSFQTINSLSDIPIEGSKILWVWPGAQIKVS